MTARTAYGAKRAGDEATSRRNHRSSAGASLRQSAPRGQAASNQYQPKCMLGHDDAEIVEVGYGEAKSVMPKPGRRFRRLRARRAAKRLSRDKSVERRAARPPSPPRRIAQGRRATCGQRRFAISTISYRRRRSGIEGFHAAANASSSRWPPSASPEFTYSAADSTSIARARRSMARQQWCLAGHAATGAVPDAARREIRRPPTASQHCLHSAGSTAIS